MSGQPRIKAFVKRVPRLESKVRKRLNRIHTALEVLSRYGTVNVAEQLKMFKIKGKRKMSPSCPIARFITKKFRSVSSSSIGVTGFIEFKDSTQTHFIRIPPLITLFMSEFDAGSFPELEEVE